MNANETRMQQMALGLLLLVLVSVMSLLVGCKGTSGWRGLKMGGGIELTTPLGNIGLSTKRGGEFTCGPSESAPLPTP